MIPRGAQARSILKNRSGQALTEYVLLLLAIVSGYLLVARGLASAGISSLMLKPLQEDFAKAYQFGHPKAELNGDSAKNHPRAQVSGENNFRIFLQSPQ